MMRVGRRRVARLWTSVDAPATALSVSIGRGVGSCGAVGCDGRVAQARGRNVHGASEDLGVRCLGTVCGPTVSAPPLLVSRGRHGRARRARGGRNGCAPVTFMCGGDGQAHETLTLTHCCGVCSFRVASCFILRLWCAHWPRQGWKRQNRGARSPPVQKQQDDAGGPAACGPRVDLCGRTGDSVVGGRRRGWGRLLCFWLFSDV